MAHKTKVSKKNHFLIAFSVIIFFVTLPTFFFVYFIGNVYPNVYTAGINLGGKSVGSAINLLQTKVIPPDEITLVINNKSFNIKTSEISLNYNFEESAKRAVELGRSGNIVFDLEQITKSLIYKTNYGLAFTVDSDKLDSQIAKIADKITTKPINPTFEVSAKQLLITAGVKGTQIDTQKIKTDIGLNLSKIRSTPIAISLIDNDYETKSFLDNAVQRIVDQEDIDPVNAKFVFVDGHVQSFLPESNGAKVDRDKLKLEIE